MFLGFFALFCFFLSNRLKKKKKQAQKTVCWKYPNLVFFFIYCHSIASLTHSIDLEWEEEGVGWKGSIAQSQASVVWS